MAHDRSAGRRASARRCGMASNQEVERCGTERSSGLIEVGVPAKRVLTSSLIAARIAESCSGVCASSVARVRAVAVANIWKRPSASASGA